MTHKLTFPLAVLALALALVAYLAPGSVVRGGEQACPALKEARDKLVAKNPNHPGLPGLDKAIANNCPDVGNVSCAQDFGLEGVVSQCYTDTTACAAGGAAACLEPSPTCDSATSGTQPVCGVHL